MKKITSVNELKKEISDSKKQGKKVGLVPTMGALHSGHISLVKKCIEDNDICVVSIFVNPTQFNDKNDLATYPRTPEEDEKKLNDAGCNILFTPTVGEMYPEKDERIFNLGDVANVMEGAYRPGHFNGVAQIVSKLFYAATPDRAYFGEKDFQQIAVIKEMAKQLDFSLDIISCPIKRERDGLAMSSRNARLSKEEREKAPEIHEILSKSLTFAEKNSVKDTIDFVAKKLSKDSIFKLDYYQIVNGETLQPVKEWADSEYIVGCIAVYCGPVRLIDNIFYKKC